MVKACGASIAKLVLFVVNVVFWLTGVFLLGVGIWSLTDANFQRIWSGLADSTLASRIPNVQAIAFLIIAMGVAMFVFGFAGCCGAFNESRCLLSIYILLMGFVMIAELAVAIVVFVFRSKMPDALQKSLTEGVRELITGWPDKNDAKAPFNQFFLPFQYDVGCCGSNNYTDYFGNSTYQTNRSPNAPKCDAVPLTCCERNSQVANNTDWSDLKPTDLMNYHKCCDISNMADTGRYQTGCFNKAKTFIQKFTLPIGVCLIVFAVFQVVIMLSAVCLCRAIGRDNEYVYV
jgi:hypothetical protein